MKYTILLLLFYANATAQQMPDYIVYMVKGDVTSQKGKAGPVKVKQNQLLYAAETLTLKQGAEITLSNKEGVGFVLNTPKSYPIASLAKQKKPSTENVSQKYLHLLYHELIDPNHDYNKFKKQNVGGVWGGVHRGGE